MGVVGVKQQNGFDCTVSHLLGCIPSFPTEKPEREQLGGKDINKS